MGVQFSKTAVEIVHIVLIKSMQSRITLLGDEGLHSAPAIDSGPLNIYGIVIGLSSLPENAVCAGPNLKNDTQPLSALANLPRKVLQKSVPLRSLWCDNLKFLTKNTQTNIGNSRTVPTITIILYESPYALTMAWRAGLSHG